MTQSALRQKYIDALMSDYDDEDDDTYNRQLAFLEGLSIAELRNALGRDLEDDDEDFELTEIEPDNPEDDDLFSDFESFDYIGDDYNQGGYTDIDDDDL